MFTGIIEETGVVSEIKKERSHTTFRVSSSTRFLKNKKIGDSIAVNGACMTIKEIKGKEFEFDAIPESLRLTNLSSMKKKDIVNLESALKIGQTLDGHFVQGHVDASSAVQSFERKKDFTRLNIKIPTNIREYLALKGSITVNGVSLTISRLNKQTFSVDLIPLTLEKTNLALLEKNDKVNLEVDLIARYLKNLIKK